MTPAFIDELKTLLGPSSVLTAPASLLVYSYDGALDKALPGAVALPRSAGEVAAVVRLAHRAGVPFVARGAGTNLCGGAIPREDGLVIHLARLNRVLEINKENARAWVEPGVVNLHFQRALAPLGLFYAPDPASQKACTLGGNVGTNAGGPHCLKHGVTTHHVTGLEVVLPDGEVARVSLDDPGWDLTGLFVGSEGTLGIVTKIEVRLLPLPADVRTLLASFPSLDAAAQTVTDIIAAGVLPTTLEVLDKVTVAAVEAFVHAGYPLDAEAVLLMEVDGERARLDKEVETILALSRKNGAAEIRQARDEAERHRLWEGRRGAYPAMAKLAPNVLVEDGVVPRNLLPEAVRRIRAIAERENLRMGLIAHAGDGNLHPNLVFDERNAAETQKVKAAGYEMLKVCVDLGGSISGEHGIGTDKREAMRWLFTPATLAFFRRIKDALDPAHLCNPDKLIPALDTTAQPGPAASSLAQVQKVLRDASARKTPVFFKGSGSKSAAPPADAVAIDWSGLNQVLEHNKDNFTITVQAGMTVAALEEYLKPHGQFAHLAGPGTVGGILSSRAQAAPRLRDLVLGMKVVLADGDVVELGGRVMKNVAGYDAGKLFIGGWGTLGAIAEVTLRLFPAPAHSFTRRAFRPFSPNSLERRLKKALDPENILSPWLFNTGAGPVP